MAEEASQAIELLEKTPVAILVEPQLGENIGAAARALWNFGLERLRLVAPRDGWPNPWAVAMASGASHVIEAASIFSTTAEAAADLQMLYATTARPRELTKRVLTPEAAMREAAGLIGEGARVGILFGRERTGLETGDVSRADAIVTVPTNPSFSSINLAQSVLILAYEWRRAHDATPPETLSKARTVLATGAELDRLIAHLTAALDAANFFYPEEKRPAMLTNLENLFRRQPLTAQDVRTLHGVIRALAEHRARKPR